MTPPSSGKPCWAPERSLALSAFVDGELGPDQALDVDAHIRRCSACADRVSLLRATRASLRRATSPSVPGPLRARVASAVARERPPRSLLPGRLVPLRYTFALALAAGIALAFGAMRERWRDEGDLSAQSGGDGLAPAAVESMLDDLVALHARPLPPETTDPDALTGFGPYVGVPVRKPAFRPLDADFKGARLHAMRDRRAALLQYTLPSHHRITVYLFDPRKIPVQVAPSLRERVIRQRPVYVGRVQGYSVAAVERGGVGYALATDLDDDESTQLVLSMAQDAAQ